MKLYVHYLIKNRQNKLHFLLLIFSCIILFNQIIKNKQINEEISLYHYWTKVNNVQFLAQTDHFASQALNISPGATSINFASIYHQDPRVLILPQYKKPWQKYDLIQW